MSVIPRDLVRWTAPITYGVTSAPPGETAKWVHEGIAEFNRLVRTDGSGTDVLKKDVFVEAASGNPTEVDFVYSDRGESAIGDSLTPSNQPKRKSKVEYHPTAGANPWATLWHEMGHCLGLGHEQFHTQWPLRQWVLDLWKKDPDEVRLLQFAASTGDADARKKTAAALRDWVDAGNYDKNSIMHYGLGAILDPTSFQEHTLGRTPRIIAAPPPAKPVLARTASGGSLKPSASAQPAPAPRPFLLSVPTALIAVRPTTLSVDDRARIRALVT